MSNTGRTVSVKARLSELRLKNGLGMIVQCPECSSQYRVSDEKVPDSGGKITCPKCSHVFVVQPDGEDDREAGAQTAVADQRRLQRMAQQHADDEAASGAQAHGGGAGASASGQRQAANVGGAAEGQEEGTVEMRNPFLDQQGGGASMDESDDPTDVLSRQNIEEAFDQAFPGQQEAGSQGESGSQNAAEQQEGAASLESHTPGADPFEEEGGRGDGSGPGGVRVGERGGSGQGGQAGAGSQPAEGPWKVETDYGLTYDFPDTEALTKWLGNRAEDVHSIQVAPEGEAFRPLSEYPQLAESVGGTSDRSDEFLAEETGERAPKTGPNQTIDSAAQQQSAQPTPGARQGGQPAGGDSAQFGARQPEGDNQKGRVDRGSDQNWNVDPVGDRGRKIEDRDFELPSDSGGANGLLYGIFAILSVVAVGLALETFEVYPVSSLIPGIGATNSTSAPAEPSPTTDGAAAADPAAADSDETQQEKNRVDQLVEAAERSMNRNRRQTAIEKLKAARLLAPKRVDVLKMMAEVYKGLGEEEKAEKSRERARQLEAKAAKEPGDAKAEGGEQSGQAPAEGAGGEAKAQGAGGEGGEGSAGGASAGETN